MHLHYAALEQERFRQMTRAATAIRIDVLQSFLSIFHHSSVIDHDLM